MRLFTTQYFPHPSITASKGAVFFLCPHGIRIKQVAFSIRKICGMGYNVYAYDFTKDALDSGNPEILPKLITETRKSIEQTIQSLPKDGEIGMFGSSLGSFITYNILDVPRLDWAVMSTGGNMAYAVWAMDDTRESMTAQGYTQDTVAEQWDHIQSPKWKFGKHPPTVILVSASRDKVATLKHARVGHEYMLSGGADSHFVVQKGLNHKYALLYNFATIRRLINKVRTLRGLT